MIYNPRILLQYYNITPKVHFSVQSYVSNLKEDMGSCRSTTSYPDAAATTKAIVDAVSLSRNDKPITIAVDDIITTSATANGTKLIGQMQGKQHEEK